jgi:predicted transcriptional regulator
MTPAPETGRAARAALRARLLEELGKHNRTTQQLATILEVEGPSIQYALRMMEGEGLITSFTDRRNTKGALSKVWVINIEKKAAERRPARDPLLWALFGSPP